MKCLLIALFALLVLAPRGAAQATEYDLEQTIANDDRSRCDAIGWSVLDSEMSTTMSDQFLIEHAACSGGENGLILIAGCMEPMLHTLTNVGPDPGQAWVGCSVLAGNGSVDGLILAPADFMLVDERGARYPFSLAASVMGGPSGLRVQELPPESQPVIGLVAFAVPDTFTAPFMLVWEPAVDGVPHEPAVVIADRLIELPAPLG